MDAAATTDRIACQKKRTVDLTLSTIALRFRVHSESQQTKEPMDVGNPGTARFKGQNKAEKFACEEGRGERKKRGVEEESKSEHGEMSILSFVNATSMLLHP